MEIIDNTLVKVGDKDIINRTFNIPSGITKIGDHAFSHCSTLLNIEIPDSVIEIGTGAFSCCYLLNSIIIPGSIEKIGIGAFENCISLRRVTILNGVKYIEMGSFHRCISLNNIIIPSSVEKIGFNAFADCSKLETVIMSPSTDYFFNPILAPYNTFKNCPNVKIIRKSEKEIKKLQNRIFVPATPNEYNSIIGKIQANTNRLKELEVKSLNAENSTTIEKFGEELKDYPMILSDIYYSIGRLDLNLENKNKKLRKILDKISGDDRNTLFEKIGKLFLNEKDDEIVLNVTAMDEIKTFSSKELDLYRKQTQMLESLRDLIKLYIQKLSNCKQELNTVFVSDSNNEIDKIDMNSLSEFIQIQEKGMNQNLTGMLDLYGKVSNDLNLNLMYVTSLKEVTTVLLPSVITEATNKKIIIRKKESVDALKEISKILKTLQPSERINVEEEKKTIK